MMGVFLILILSIAANPLNQSFIDTAMETVKLMASAQIVAHTCTQKIVEQRDLTVLNLCEKFFHVLMTNCNKSLISIPYQMFPLLRLILVN